MHQFLHNFGLGNRDEGYLDLVLTLDSFKGALNRGIIDFPDISEEEIEDKNGRDALSKTIAMLQLLWFVLQIAARSRQNLAITELELSTAALAILNIGMYISWWKKPTDVSCPTIIRSRVRNKPSREPENRNFGANIKVNVMTYYWLQLAKILEQAFDAILRFFRITLKTMVTYVYEAICSLPERFANVLQNFRKRWERGTRAGSTAKRRQMRTHVGTGFSRTGTGDPRIGQHPIVHDDTGLSRTGTGDATIRQKSEAHDSAGWLNYAAAVIYAVIGFVTVSVKWIAWVLLHIFQVLIYYPILAISSPSSDDEDTEAPSSDTALEATGIHYTNIASLSKTTTIRLLFEQESRKIRLSMKMIFVTEAEESAPFFCVSAFSGMLFGMIHCLAWNFNSPSQSERILWRVPSLGVVGLCFFMLVGGIIYTLTGVSPKNIGKKTIFTFRVLSSFLYISSRLSLLTLSFLSLRALPDSALDTVQWSLFIPHI